MSNALNELHDLKQNFVDLIKSSPLTDTSKERIAHYIKNMEETFHDFKNADLDDFKQLYGKIKNTEAELRNYISVTNLNEIQKANLRQKLQELLDNAEAQLKFLRTAYETHFKFFGVNRVK